MEEQEVHIIIGGDAQMKKTIYDGIPASEDTLKALRLYFPELKPLWLPEGTNIHQLPDIKCCACNYYGLPIRPTLEKTLTLTHIHHSLRIERGDMEGAYLLCNHCVRKIRLILYHGLGKELTPVEILASAKLEPLPSWMTPHDWRRCGNRLIA